MDIKTVGLSLLIFVAWGLSAYVEKLATQRIGERTVFWDFIIRIPIMLTYSFLVFKVSNLFDVNKEGLLLGMLGGALGAIGMITFFVLLTRKDASAAVPLSALYPALTAILAFIFLRESLTLVKAFGITFAMVAVYLLSL
jgi:transporter family protein